MTTNFKPPKAWPAFDDYRSGAMTGGRTRAREAIDIGRGQAINSSVGLDNQGKPWGPTPSLLEDNFRERSLLRDAAPGASDALDQLINPAPMTTQPAATERDDI